MNAFALLRGTISPLPNPLRPSLESPIDPRQSGQGLSRRRFQAASLLCLCVAVAAAARAASDDARTGAALAPGSARISVEAQSPQTPAPLLFTADVDQTINISSDEISSEATVSFHILQGRPEVLTLGINGDGEVTNVTGAGVRDWSVRQGSGDAGGKRYLDIRATLSADTDGPKDIVAKIRLRHEVRVPSETALPLVGRGRASALSWHGRIEPARAVDVGVAHAVDVVPVEATGSERALEFVSHGAPGISCRVLQRGASIAPAEFSRVQLNGQVDEKAASVVFHVIAAARVEEPGAHIKVLSGLAAFSGATAGDGWHVELVSDDEGPSYEMVFDRKGAIAVTFDFVAGIRDQEGWQSLDFHLFGSSVVSVSLSGLGSVVEFDPGAALVLHAAEGGWHGFLPADGNGTLRWKKTREQTDAALFFTSTEESDIRVAAGLLRQVSQVHLRVMQGKLSAVTLRVEGPGEIVGVDGANVVGWRVSSGKDSRTLEVRLSRPIENEATLTVRSQDVLADFPVRAEPLRLTPVGGVRHAGFVRIANAGAVRLEVSDVEGMMQLATTQFPGTALEAGARQVFVYRFSSGARRFAVQASQIVPEVGVSQITTYLLAETDRIIESDLELDIREAPLRDWAIQIPAAYAVVSVQGANIGDYVAETAVIRETRTLKVMFAEPVIGRQLIRLRLEASQVAKAGEWRIPAIQFPTAKSVRGHIGIVSTPGYRITPTVLGQLAEVPLTVFPRQTSGLQQAFRIRDAAWSATVGVEALGQSVQADVFHLYSVKQGAVSVSVLLNYFIVGAPSAECRIEVPAAAGNIDVIGQGVRRDWRREGNVIVVALHQPVLGALTMLVTFEEPLGARGGAIRPGEVRPLNVHSERGYVELVSALELQMHVAKSEGSVLKLEPLELPAELRLLTTAPALATYQYTARPFALELNVSAYPSSDTVDQIVDFAKLSSRVARDGQVVTECWLYVKTRGRKMLRLQLPLRVKLWEARVDGELVTPRLDSEWTVLPLSARLNPNEPVPVALRLGQSSLSARSIQLAAPRLTMPLVIGEWTLKSDRERLLVPEGGTAELLAPNLTETGFAWIADHGRSAVLVLVLAIALAGLFARLRTTPALVCTFVAAAFAGGLAFVLANDAIVNRRSNRRDLMYASTVVPADAPVTLKFANLPEWQAMLSPWGVAAIGAGVVALSLAAHQRRHGKRGAPLAAAVGCASTAAGVLAQHGGAAVFFGASAAVMSVVTIIAAVRCATRLWATWRSHPGPAGNSASSAAASMLLMGALSAAVLGHVPAARADTASAGLSHAQSLTQRWDIRGHRLYAECDVTLRGTPGDSILLLRSPAVLTEFSGNGLHVSTIINGDQTAYYVVPDRAGQMSAIIKYELPVTDLSKGLPVLTGSAAVQHISVQLDQPGWRFSSPAAVQVSPMKLPAPNQSGATLVLAVGGEPIITLAPEQRDLNAEATRFFAEVANLYVPSPGVVNASARVTVRPAQGRVSVVEIDVPEGFSIGDVTTGPVGGWQFDPTTRKLHVTIEPAQPAMFKFTVELQRAAAALPTELSLQPLHVADAAGQFGSLAVACGPDAQAEQLRPTGMAMMSTDDFDRTLIPHGRDNQPLASVQAAYRYSDEHAELALRVAPIEPDVRVTSRQLLSLGDDRVVLAADLVVTITRVGLFQLSFAVPAGLDIEAVSGSALSHWTDATEGGLRILTLHLNSRTIGEQTFAITLAGPAPTMNKPWEVPQLRLREATRQSGELQVVPERGIRLRTIERKAVSEIDPRSIGETRPGMLAFRLLDESAALTLGIEALDPWVTVQALEEITIREGQKLTRLALHYHVENAAVRHLGVGFSGMTPEEAKTVHASGSAVSDLVPVPGTPGKWDIRFQRGIIGETDVQIEFQAATGAEKTNQTVVPVVFDGARQVEYFAALRSGGRLELETAVLPRGWQRVDWSAIPGALQDRSDRTVPALSFRVAELENPLEVSIKRHALADSLKLRVTAAQLVSIFSPRGAALTAVELQISVAEKSPLRVRLPEHAILVNAFVNGENVPVVRDGEEYPFHVTANTAADPSARVRLVYAVANSPTPGIALLAPRLNIPLENVTWRTVLPPGYALTRYEGTLRLSGERAGTWFDLNDYESSVASNRAAEAKQATDFLQTASVLLQQGQGLKAGEILLRATRSKGLDDASNEDARVQLRTLRTQQTVVGLNTRRQRLYLDNSAEALRNEQLEQAATLNPVMRGRLDFDPQQLDQLLMGNSVEDNAALRGIADRIVDQQLAAEPVTNAIDVTLPERGKVVTFTRSIQVNGDAPLELRLSIAREDSSNLVFALFILGSIGAIAGLWMPKSTAAATPIEKEA